MATNAAAISTKNRKTSLRNLGELGENLFHSTPVFSLSPFQLPPNQLQEVGAMPRFRGVRGADGTTSTRHTEPSLSFELVERPRLKELRRVGVLVAWAGPSRDVNVMSVFRGSVRRRFG